MTQQSGFDFTGMRAELGTQYESFVQAWADFHAHLAARGHHILPAGRKLAAMIERFGMPFVKQAATLSRAPGWRRCQSLVLAYEWLGDVELPDHMAAVLDSVVYTNMTREQRQKALQMMRSGATAQQIDDFLDATRAPGVENAKAASITHNEVQDWYARTLEDAGWNVRKNQPTEDGGEADLVATKDDQLLLVECKVDLTRDVCIEALGQLTLYGQTFRGARRRVAYWHAQDAAQSIMEVCRDTVLFDKVARPVTEPAA